MFLWSGLCKNNACTSGGIQWLDDEGWQRDLLTDDLGQFRPGDGPKVRSRLADRYPQPTEKRNTDAGWGYIGGGVIGRLRRLRRQATSCTPTRAGRGSALLRR